MQSKTSRKIFSRNYVICTIVALFFLIAPMLLYAYIYIDIEMDTVYASGYSWRRFSRVKEGTSISEVVSLLGEPLKKYEIDSEVWWVYFANKGKILIDDRKHIYAFNGIDKYLVEDFMKWRISYEEFKNYCKGELKSTTPIQIAIWHYAGHYEGQCGGDGSHLKRMLLIDMNGEVVIKKEASLYWD